MKVLTSVTGVKKQVLNENGTPYFTLEHNSLFRPGSSKIQFDGKDFQISKIEYGFGNFKYHLADMGGSELALVIVKQGFSNQAEVMFGQDMVFKVDGNGCMNMFIRGFLGLLVRLFIPVTYNVMKAEQSLGTLEIRFAQKKIMLDEDIFNALTEDQKLSLLTALTLVYY